MDFNAAEFHLLAQPDRVCRIAGEAVDMFDEDGVESPTLSVFDHTQ